MYINCPKLSQLEPVIPKPRQLFGFGTILCPETYIMLNHVRHVKVWCGIPFCDGQQCGGCKCSCVTCETARHGYGCVCIVCENNAGVSFRGQCLCVCVKTMYRCNKATTHCV